MDKKEALRNIIYNLKEIDSARLRLSTGKPENIDIELALLNQQVLNIYRHIQNYQSGLYASHPAEEQTIIQHEAAATRMPEPAPIKEKPAPAKAPEPVIEFRQQDADVKKANKDAQLRKERLKRLEAEMREIQAEAQKEQTMPAVPEPAPTGETEDFTELVNEKVEEAEIAEEAARASGKEMLHEHHLQTPANEQTLNEKLQSGTKAKESLNEKFAHNDAKKTIAEKLKTGSVTDLKSAIALNQKIAFTNSLFGGDDKEFKKALAFLNNCTNFSEAKFYIQSDLSKRFNWQDNPLLAEEFTEIVYRKF